MMIWVEVLLESFLVYPIGLFDRRNHGKEYPC